jgi:hypothetical protein
MYRYLSDSGPVRRISLRATARGLVMIATVKRPAPPTLPLITPVQLRLIGAPDDKCFQATLTQPAVNTERNFLATQ